MKKYIVYIIKNLFSVVYYKNGARCIKRYNLDGTSTEIILGENVRYED